MSKSLTQNYTAHINCMIISGFPGIGKTSTFLEMKRSFIGAKCYDMDVSRYGTTNGINVEDPAAYVKELETRSHENACIFVTIDPEVRVKMQEAHLFYLVVAPEFPPSIGSSMPIGAYKPDPLLRANYMKRFSTAGYSSLCAQTLDGEGYVTVLEELFRDPMPHLVSPILNKAVVDQGWAMVEQMTRQTISAQQLTGMAPGGPQLMSSLLQQQGRPPMPPMPGGLNLK